jgi:two-component system cell cycle response regulator DivK
VAEDSSVIQNLTKKILQIQNYSISSVKNGQQVLKHLETENYDVILMDINMPIMDGMECAKRIRSLSDKEKAETPIIAITGNAKNYTIEDFKAVGINEYLPKPLNFDDLVETVKKYT